VIELTNTRFGTFHTSHKCFIRPIKLPSIGGRFRGAVRSMQTPLAPDKGMALCIPVDGSAMDRLGDLVPALDAPAGSRRRAQDLPSGLDQQASTCSGTSIHCAPPRPDGALGAAAIIDLLLRPLGRSPAALHQGTPSIAFGAHSPPSRRDRLLNCPQAVRWRAS
jgi:hypothetical protein